jgi:carbonic anhydrase
MVTLPPEFVATKYPGYFWNVETQALYTAKLGVLRELKYYGPNRWNHYVEGYRVCDQGERRTLMLKYLKGLKRVDHQMFPVEYQFTVGQTDSDEGVIDLRSMPRGTKVTISIR